MPDFNSAQFNSGGQSAGNLGATSVSDLLYAALRIARVTNGPRRGPSPEQLSDSFVAFRGLISALNIEPLAIFSTAIEQYPLLSAKQIFTIGPGADFDAARPNRIVRANFYPSFAPPASSGGSGGTATLTWDQIPGNWDEITGNFDDVGAGTAPVTMTEAQTFDQVPGNFDEIQGNWDSVGAAVAVTGETTGATVAGPNIALRLPLKVWSAREWAHICLQNIQTTIPRGFYYDADFPVAGLHFWPIPVGGGTLELFTWKPLGNFQALDDAVVLPDGYQEAITYNLAQRVAAMFGTQMTPGAELIARDSLARIKRNNNKTPLMRADLAIDHRSAFDWTTGENC
jgi:hypothetical protein